ncbi:MAG: enoyl-CoA hydratase, partial [Myxococcales bacterium]|nr:enoyl-CoA hydratase [Myxococcales bacterium]
VLLGARGRMFCAGGDLGAFQGAGDTVPTLLKEITTHLHAAISRLARMRAPVIAAVTGTAAGAGFSLLCAVDLVLASEEAKFTMAYTQVGLAPDGSSTYWLPRLIGNRRTVELMLTNRVLRAEEAHAWGLVNQVLPPEQVESEALALAQRIAAGPTEAFGLVKKLVLESAGNTLETQMELESRGIADAARTADAQEGMAAFFEKRNPTFSGR